MKTSFFKEVLDVYLFVITYSENLIMHNNPILKPAKGITPMFQVEHDLADQRVNVISFSCGQLCRVDVV